MESSWVSLHYGFHNSRVKILNQPFLFLAPANKGVVWPALWRLKKVVQDCLIQTFLLSLSCFVLPRDMWRHARTGWFVYQRSWGVPTGFLRTDTPDLSVDTGVPHPCFSYSLKAQKPTCVSLVDQSGAGGWSCVHLNRVVRVENMRTGGTDLQLLKRRIAPIVLVLLGGALNKLPPIRAWRATKGCIAYLQRC